MEKISILFWFSNMHEALAVTEILVPLRYMSFDSNWKRSGSGSINPFKLNASNGRTNLDVQTQLSQIREKIFP